MTKVRVLEFKHDLNSLKSIIVQVEQNTLIPDHQKNLILNMLTNIKLNTLRNYAKEE